MRKGWLRKIVDKKKHDLLLYYSPSCPYCLQVLNFMEKAGISLPKKNVYESPAIREELRALNGKTQVPCLVIDGKPMLESDDIIAWLKKHLVS